MIVFDEDIYSFHDDLVMGIQTKMDVHEAAITIVCIDNNKEYIITLIGLHGLRVDDFRQGNIISYIHIYETHEIPMDRVAPLLEMTADDFLSSKYYHVYQQEINSEKLVMFNLGSSYGCEIIALCKKVYISE